MRPDYVLDANLLVLLVIGAADRDGIGQSKRLSGYDATDYDVLEIVLTEAASVIVPPHVLAETSNLIGHGDDPHHRDLAAVFSALVASFDERHVSARDAMKRPEFERLGLTDAALLLLASTGPILLTADDPLFSAACAVAENGCQAELFEALRWQYRSEV